jgi:hypothetical protein
MRILDGPVFGVCLVQIYRMQLGQAAITLEWLIVIIILEWLPLIRMDFHLGDGHWSCHLSSRAAALCLREDVDTGELG